MNFGTRCSEGVFAAMGALVIAGSGTRGGAVRAAVLVGGADGVDRAGPVTVEEPVTVEDAGLGVAEPLGAVAAGKVGVVAPEQPAKTNVSALAPPRERAAYRRGSLTGTHCNEPT